MNGKTISDKEHKNTEVFVETALHAIRALNSFLKTKPITSKLLFN